MKLKLIVEHIRTSAGARFSTYTDDEDRRVQLIQYWNEVHADGEDDRFDDDTDLMTVEEAIEEIEDVNSEDIWLDVPPPEGQVLIDISTLRCLSAVAEVAVADLVDGLDDGTYDEDYINGHSSSTIQKAIEVADALTKGGE